MSLQYDVLLVKLQLIKGSVIKWSVWYACNCCLLSLHCLVTRCSGARVGMLIDLLVEMLKTCGELLYWNDAGWYSFMEVVAFPIITVRRFMFAGMFVVHSIIHRTTNKNCILLMLCRDPCCCYCPSVNIVQNDDDQCYAVHLAWTMCWRTNTRSGLHYWDL